MPVLLLVVGAITLILGVGAIGYGIPINEFSFGNTLIVAGMTAAVGGLIVIALGAVVAQLHRLGETLAAGTAARPARAPGAFEGSAVGRVPAGRMPFPGPPRADTVIPAPPSGAVTVDHEAVDDLPGLSAEPVLCNPDTPPLATEDHLSLTLPPRGGDGPGSGEAPSQEQSWERPQPSAEPRPRATNFDAMWPPLRPRPEPSPAVSPERPHESARETMQTAPAEPDPGAAESPPGAPENAPRAAAILKTGVVDGMGYTLYVDGSIEAELPQGTLRFASINELRSHLEKNP